MLPPIKLMALVTSDATNGTNKIAAIIATMNMTIRHARFMFMAPPLSKIWAYSNGFSLLFALEQPQNTPDKD
jgi:hypothetical protein